MDRFAAAALHFDRTGNRHRHWISRSAICEFYARRIQRARTPGELARLTAGDVLVWLRRRSSLASPTKAAVTKALYDVRRQVNDEWINLRTTGALLVRPRPDGARLDSPMPSFSGAYRAAESAAQTLGSDAVEIPAVVADGSIRADPPVLLRQGARVRVWAAPQDVLGASAVSPLAPGTLAGLVGLVSLGGDALVDSQRWEGLDE